MVLRVKIKVKTGSREEKIEPSNDGYQVFLAARPHNNEANKSLISLLAKSWHLPQAALRIARGAKSKEKIIEIITK